MSKELKHVVLETAENGIITSERLTALGIYRGLLSALIDRGEIVKCTRGVYMRTGEWEDEFFVLQHRYKKGIFSHTTALYLWGYSERVPLELHMTFPTNYNSKSLNNENVAITRVIKANYDLGLTTMTTPVGNQVNVYNLERTLCDILRGSGEDIQTIQYAMKKYVSSKEKDINKLIKYAKQLRVEPKIRRYIEVLI